MNLRRLTYFLRIAELGSFNRASEALRIAQPALSRQIRMLEEELGVVLFERTLRGVTLTEPGERLRGEIVGPLRQLDFAFENVSLSGDQVAGAITIGIVPELRGILGAKLLDLIETEEPGISARIVEAEVDHLAEWALRGNVDLLIYSGPSPDEAVIDRPLLSEDLFLVGCNASGLTPASPVRFDAMTALPLILPEARSGVLPLLEKPAYVNKTSLNVVQRVNSFELLKELVAAGKGYTVLPLSAFGREAASGELRHAPVTDPALAQPVSIGATRDCRVPRLATRLDPIIRHVMTYLVESGRWPARLLFEPEAPK